MGKLKQELMAQTMDDMGEPTLSQNDFMQLLADGDYDPTAWLDDYVERKESALDSEMAEVEHTKWELTKVPTHLLEAELRRRSGN